LRFYAIYRGSENASICSQHGSFQMVWYLDKEKDYKIIDEIDNESDRVAAIVGAALLEGHLLESIESRLFVAGKYNKEIALKLCGQDGPLGSFGARINAGLLLGIYLQETHSDLVNIAYIRNYFAHRPSVRKFEHRDVRKLCKKFALITRVVPKELLAAKKAGDTPHVPFDEIASFVNAQTMRWRYIRTLQIIIGCLMRQKVNQPPLPPLPTPF
jgi:hypothetical protein